jgi:4-hydroxy-3-polyprenylbenzoate decarboxylase
VEAGVNVRDFSAVLREIRGHFRPERDFLLLPRVPLDTLDFTSFEMHLGSKMVLDATRAGKPPATDPPPAAFDLRRLAHEAVSWRLWEDTLLAVQVSGNGRQTLERLAQAPELERVKMMAAVSTDVDLEDQTQLLWGIFTRFDPARDVVFPHMTLHGASPVYRGVMGIDATHKPGYPKRLEMLPEVRRRVDERWAEYFG